MSGLPNISDQTPLLSHKKIEPSGCTPILVALMILGAISLTIACLGTASFGTHQSWWSAGVLSQINQVDALILMATGVGSTFVFLIAGIVSNQIQNQKKVEELENEVLKREGAYAQSAATEKTLETKQKELDQVRALKDKALQDRSKEQQTWSEEKQKLQGNLDALRTEQSKVTSQLKEVQAKYDALLTLSQEKLDLLSQLEQAKRELEQTQATLKSECTHLNTQLKDAQEGQQELRTQLQTKTEEFNKVELAKGELDKEKASLTSECIQLKIQLGEAKLTQQALLVQSNEQQAWGEEKLSLQSTVGKLKEEQNQLNTQLKEVQASYDALLAQSKAKLNLLTELEQTKKGLEQTQATLQSQCTQLNTQLKDAQEGQQELRTQLQTKTEEFNKVKLAKVELEKETASLTAECTQLKIQLGKATVTQEALLAQLQVKNDGPAKVEAPVAAPRKRNRSQQAWDVFNYDQAAEHKYQAVLDAYRSHLTVDLLQQLQKDLTVDSKNPMLAGVHNMLQCLLAPTNPRTDYQKLIQELRKVIQSAEYQAISSASSPENLTIRKFIRRFCLVRWKEISLFNYLKGIVHFTIEEEQLPEFNLETFPDTILKVNEKVKKSRNKKSKLALEGQKLAGALGLEDFCGSKNTPHLRSVQVFSDEEGNELPIAYARHGTPTALGPDYYSLGIACRQIMAPFARMVGYEIESGEEVTSDYKEYLKALEDQGESELFCVYQRRSQNVFENERTRAVKIDGLQEKHPNIFVLTQPVEGDLFEHKGKYSDVSSFEDLKKGLEHEFFDTDPKDVYTSAALPAYVRDEIKEEYRQVFRGLLNDVQDIFFSDQKQAFDPSLNTSLIEIEGQLATAYQKQAEAIQAQLATVDLETLENTEQHAVHENVLTLLLQDTAGWEKIVKGQIRSVEQLQKWIPVDTSKSADVLLQDPQVLNAVIRAVIISVAEKTVKADESTEKLEEQKANFLAQWQSFILLFYAFQKMDLKTRLNGVRGFKLAAYKTPCKDFLDRGGNQAFVDDRLHDYIMGVEKDPRRMQEALYNLLGPPILVKKKEAIPARIIPGMKVEKILASMSPEARERLSNYRFGKGKWKIARQYIPKEKGQTGIPLLSQTMQKEIALASGDLTTTIPAVFKKYSGIDLRQWKPWISPPQEKQEYDLFTPQQQENLLQHTLIQNDQTKMIDVLSSFQQAIVKAIPDSLISVIGGEKFDEHFDLKLTEFKPEIDLTYPDRITLNFSVTYALTNKQNGEILCQFPTSVKTICRPKKDSKLHSRTYVRWSVG